MHRGGHPAQEQAHFQFASEHLNDGEGSGESADETKASSESTCLEET